MEGPCKQLRGFPGGGQAPAGTSSLPEPTPAWHSLLRPTTHHHCLFGWILARDQDLAYNPSAPMGAAQSRVTPKYGPCSFRANKGCQYRPFTGRSEKNIYSEKSTLQEGSSGAWVSGSAVLRSLGSHGNAARAPGRGAPAPAEPRAPSGGCERKAGSVCTHKRAKEDTGSQRLLSRGP